MIANCTENRSVFIRASWVTGSDRVSERETIAAVIDNRKLRINEEQKQRRSGKQVNFLPEISSQYYDN